MRPPTNPVGGRWQPLNWHQSGVAANMSRDFQKIENLYESSRFLPFKDLQLTGIGPYV